MSEDASHHGSGDFTELQRALLGTQTIEQFLQEVALLAARLVPDGMSCGMTMRPNGQPVTVACSDELASRVDELQYQRGDGPCLHALRQGCTVRVEDMATGSDWPGFGAEAASRGIGSCLALPLIADGKPVGVLSLYARAAGAFGAAETRRAEQLAGNASGALSLALRLASYAALTDQLRSSLASRAVIDQAIGVIMAQERCTQTRAFDLLRGASQNRNVKLRDLAAAIVTSVSGEPPKPLVFEDG
jgi:GAF domain-containing protein